MILENSTRLAHLEVGSENDIAFVFSCPGKKEEEKGAPVKGQTGANLEDFICILGDRKQLCHSTRNKFMREKIRITNAWDKVEYKSSCRNRTEPTISEILCPSNLERLACELRDIQIAIICCGKKATLAICRLKIHGKLPNPKIIILPHLGNQALNSMIPNKDCDSVPPDIHLGACRGTESGIRRRLRLTLVAEQLLAQW